MAVLQPVAASAAVQESRPRAAATRPGACNACSLWQQQHTSLSSPHSFVQQLPAAANFAVCCLQEVPELSTCAVLLLHHTDCGAMAAMRHHDQLVSRMKQLLSEWGVTTWAVQVRSGKEGQLLLLLLNAQQLLFDCAVSAAASALRTASTKGSVCCSSEYQQILWLLPARLLCRHALQVSFCCEQEMNLWPHKAHHHYHHHHHQQ